MDKWFFLIEWIYIYITSWFSYLGVRLWINVISGSSIYDPNVVFVLLI